ncbi:hypothetical protein HOV23_gp094 [Pseudomonas phage Lana]|uniref:Uncharacterized protein n=1 Tax=Pseudomonas phage Lana TaxID=2530172 RepID=A0A481W7N4_9CAUD|nr:hypothetical protein HOV23_gp094 [Pseudomonas phage Lana]QBJ04479.1 hypothetical protein [Pseudomonas phage Lana]
MKHWLDVACALLIVVLGTGSLIMVSVGWGWMASGMMTL